MMALGRGSSRLVSVVLETKRSKERTATLYVFASKAGAPTHPDWHHNLTSAGKAQVEVGTDTYDVTVSELVGEERDRLFEEQGMAGYGAGSVA